jgi:hypothetical protein
MNGIRDDYSLKRNQQFPVSQSSRIGQKHKNSCRYRAIERFSAVTLEGNPNNSLYYSLLPGNGTESGSLQTVPTAIPLSGDIRGNPITFEQDANPRIFTGDFIRMRPGVSGGSHRLAGVYEGVFCSRHGCILQKRRHFGSTWYQDREG